VKAVLDTSQIADVMEKGVNTFMEAVPSLMKALDEVAKIHPFISGELHRSDEDQSINGGKHTVAVLAFKAVYTLEVTRRENDRRILALYAEYVV
jgi:hypothetical protein